MASDHSLHKLLDYGSRTFTLFDVRHVHHVSSQLPYALTVATVSFLTFIVAGFTHTWGMATSAIVSWIFGMLMLGLALFYLNKRQKS